MNQIRQTQVFITQDHKTNPEWYHTSHESFPGPRLPRSKRDIISSRDDECNVDDEELRCIELQIEIRIIFGLLLALP